MDTGQPSISATVAHSNVVVPVEKALHGNYPGLVGMFEIEMRCSSSACNSEAGLNTTILYSRR